MQTPSALQKRRVCKAVIEGTLRPSDACYRWRIQYQTLSRWMKQYKERGDKAFEPRKKKLRPRQVGKDWYRSKPQLEPREVALIRYGMMGVSDDQVAALYGKTRSYIWQLRNGTVGPKVAAPPTPPKVRSKAEANHWFIHKAIKTLEAWMEMLDKIEREDDPNIEQNLREADYEGEPRREEGRTGGTDQRGNTDHSDTGGTADGFTGLSGGDRAAEQEAGRGEPGSDQPLSLPVELPAIQTPDPGQYAGSPGQDGAGQGTGLPNRVPEGFIRRRRW